jgi:hypothetical protein
MPNRTDIWSLNISMKCGRISSLESVSSHCCLSAPQMFENAIPLPELQDKARLKHCRFQNRGWTLCWVIAYIHATKSGHGLAFLLGFWYDQIVLLFSTFQMSFISRTTQRIQMMVCPSDRLKIEQSGSGGLHYIALFYTWYQKEGWL